MCIRKKYCPGKSVALFITGPGNPPFFLVSILGLCLVPGLLWGGFPAHKSPRVVTAERCCPCREVAVQGLRFWFSSDKRFPLWNQLPLSCVVSVSKSQTPCYAPTFSTCSHETSVPYFSGPGTRGTLELLKTSEKLGSLKTVWSSRLWL